MSTIDVIQIIIAGIMTILGSLVSAHNPSKRSHKWAWGFTFVTLGIALIVLMFAQGRNNATAAQSLKDSIGRLETSSAEITRVQQLNTQLQQKLMESSGTISSLSKRSLDAITGADAYAYVMPQIGSGVPAVPLSIHNYGNTTLTGVSIEMFRGRELLTPGFGAFKHIEVGTLSAHETRLLGVSITPSLEGAAFDGYQMRISAQNGSVRQNIYFRPGKDGFEWAFKYVVDRSIELPHQKGDPPDMTRFDVKVLDKREWSDDINLQNRAKQAKAKQ